MSKQTGIYEGIDSYTHTVLIDAGDIDILVLYNKKDAQNPIACGLYNFALRQDGLWTTYNWDFLTAKDAMIGAMAVQKHGLKGYDFGRAAALILV